MKLIRTVFTLIHFLLLNSLFSYSQPADISSVPEKRLALVIGNGKYINSMELANPVNDARAMKTLLMSVGFDVYEYEDLNQSQIKKAIDEFGQRLREYSVGLFLLCRTWNSEQRIKLSYSCRCHAPVGTTGRI